MEAHFGVDRRSNVNHAMVATAANVHDSAVLCDLLHGEDRDVSGIKLIGGLGDIIKGK